MKPVLRTLRKNPTPPMAVSDSCVLLKTRGTKPILCLWPRPSGPTIKGAPKDALFELVRRWGLWPPYGPPKLARCLKCFRLRVEQTEWFSAAP
jgi:hypothetical protein